MFILNFALVAFLLGGGIITLTNWIAEKPKKNAAMSSGQ